MGIFTEESTVFQDRDIRRSVRQQAGEQARQKHARSVCVFLSLEIAERTRTVLPGVSDYHASALGCAGKLDRAARRSGRRGLRLLGYIGRGIVSASRCPGMRPSVNYLR